MHAKTLSIHPTIRIDAPFSDFAGATIAPLPLHFSPHLDGLVGATINSYVFQIGQRLWITTDKVTGTMPRTSDHHISKPAEKPNARTTLETVAEASKPASSATAKLAR